MEEEAVVEAPAPPAPVPANAVRVLHKFSGYGDFEGSVVSMEADGACSVKWDADGSITTLDQPRFERARRRYAEKHGLMPPPSSSGRPKKGAHDTRAPPAPARGRQAPTPARTPTTQKRSPRAAPRRWSADEEASLRRLVGELGRDAWETIAERLGTGRSASACEQKWQSLMNWTDLTPAPAPIDALLRDVAEEDELAAAPVAATALAAVQRAEVLSRRLEAQTREVEVALAGAGPADDSELGSPRGD